MGHLRVTMRVSLARTVLFEKQVSKVGSTSPNELLSLTQFPGYVVSDWGATHDSAQENANAGLDMEQPGDYIVIGR